MAYISKSRLDKCLIEGKSREQRVMNILTSTYGGKCEKSTLNEDKFRHVDFWWTTKKGNIISVDAKSIDKYGNYWCEAQNVTGHKGAIYGEADYFAYESEKKILLVRRKNLVKLYEEKVKGKDYVTYNPRKSYIPYKRSNWICKYDSTKHNDDLLFIAEEKDLMSFDDTILINVD